MRKNRKIGIIRRIKIRKLRKGTPGRENPRLFSLVLAVLLVVCLCPAVHCQQGNVEQFLNQLDQFEVSPGSYDALNGRYDELQPASSDDELDRFLYQSLMNTVSEGMGVD